MGVRDFPEPQTTLRRKWGASAKAPHRVGDCARSPAKKTVLIRKLQVFGLGVFWVLPILELPDRFGGMEQNWNKMLGQKPTTPARAGMFRLRNKIGLLLKKSVVARGVANWALPFAESLNRLSARMHGR